MKGLERIRGQNATDREKRSLKREEIERKEKKETEEMSGLRLVERRADSFITCWLLQTIADLLVWTGGSLSLTTHHDRMR